MTETELLELENQQLRDRIAQLELQLQEALISLKRARDPNPLERPSFKRVSFLAREACMNLQRVRGGWQLSIGHLKRKFRRLRDIWELLTQEDWRLSDIFEVAQTAVRSRVNRPSWGHPTFEAAAVMMGEDGFSLPFDDLPVAGITDDRRGVGLLNRELENLTPTRRRV